MIRRTFIDKISTIVNNSKINTSQNPVCELYYGKGFSRVLLWFDTTKIKSLIDDKTFSDTSKVKHYLKMKNTYSLTDLQSNIVFNSGKDTVKERTSSFDLYLVRLTEPWDLGVGNDFTKDGFLTKNYSISENGVNWFQAKTNLNWAIPGAFNGVSGKTDNVVSTQHFEIGNEDLNMDITDELNRIISGDTNYGYALCFSSDFEELYKNTTQYVGFFTNKTKSFFKPFIESQYEFVIKDDRYNFYLDKNNKIYLPIMNPDTLEFTNLDVTPKCFLDDVEYTVKQATKGIYYVDINLSSQNIAPDIMLYLSWTNLYLNGVNIQNSETEFITKSFQNFIGSTNFNEEIYIPQVYGINNGQKINAGNNIHIYVVPKVIYTTKKVYNVGKVFYKLYVKNGNEEVIVHDYQELNFLDRYYITLYTDELLPNKYFVDIKITSNNNDTIHKEKLKFEIIN